jgi:hypothetical protein
MAQLGIAVGMTVRDADGKRLGKVTRCDPWAFEVQRGIFSPYQWTIRYDEILELGDDWLKIARSDSDLFELAAGGLPHAWEPIRPVEAEDPLPATPAERSVLVGQPHPRSPERSGSREASADAAYDVEHPA